MISLALCFAAFAQENYDLPDDDNTSWKPVFKWSDDRPEDREALDTWMPGLSLRCVVALEDHYDKEIVAVIMGLHYFYCAMPYMANEKRSRRRNSTSVPVPAECYVFKVLGAPCSLYGAMSQTYAKMANTTAYGELVEKLGHAVKWTTEIKDEIKEAGSKLTDNKFFEKMTRLHTRAMEFLENADPRDPLSKTGNTVETVKEYGNKAVETVKEYGNKAVETVKESGSKVKSSVKKYGNKAKNSVKKSFRSGWGKLRGIFGKRSRTEE